MARTKSIPLRREPSSEYTSKSTTTGTPSKSPRNLSSDVSPVPNGSTNGKVNGHLRAGIDIPAVKEAGIPQLVMAVGGIYASLYVG